MIKKDGLWGFLRQRGRLGVCVVLGTLGLLLLLFSGTGEKTAETAVTDDAAAAASMIAEYQADLEKELEHFCESAAGVSDAEVKISLSGGFRREYLTDKSGKPVTVGSGSSERALERAVSPPTVSGVGVVCRHGNDPQIQKTLTELLSAALGIPSNRIYVTGK